MKHKKRIQLFEDFQAMPKEAPAPPKPKTVPDTRPDTRPREPKTPDPFRPVRPRIKPVPLNQIVDKFIDKYIELSKNDPGSIEILSKYEK